MMDSEVVMAGDLAAILRALAVTAAATLALEGSNTPHAAAYRQGYMAGFAAALGAVATAAHVRPEELRGDLAAQPTFRG